MNSLQVIFAALDPAGPLPAVCGILWTLLTPSSAIAALVSAVLCSFRRTANQSHRLAQTGLWTGVAAVVAGVTGVLITAGWEPPKNVDPASATLLIFLTAVAPVLAFFTRHWSRRKMREIGNSPIADAPSSIRKL